MVERVVITGCTGAIGMAFLQKCIEENIEVLAICHRGSKRIQNIPKHTLITVQECDLAELKNLQVASEDSYDVFYHLAWNGTFGDARNNMYLQNENVTHTLDAVQLAKRLGCHTFIGTGSQAEYGRVEGILRPHTPTNPENGYGIAKLCAGHMSRILCEQLDMKHIWTRILSVYGPYDGAETMVSSTIRKLQSGQVPKCTLGEQLWDYLHSSDAANALYLMGIHGSNGATYVLGSGQARPLKEYIQIMCQVYNPKIKPALGAVPYGKNQVMHLEADITELVRDTGFCVEVKFEEGIGLVDKP
ncbi:MAG: NAD(P)-dependent oxidoreductase [Eubacteriales bacterium]